MNQLDTPTPILVTLIINACLAVSAGPASAQSSSPPPLATVAPAPSAKTSGGVSGGSGVKPYRYHSVVSLFWHDNPPIVVPRRRVTLPITDLPRARATTPPVVLNPTIPFQTKPTGLSTALPGWKVASSVLQTSSSPPTGHTTYTAPAVMNTYDVVVPRRRFSYAVSFVRAY